MAKEKPKPPQKAEPINEKVLKGVWVDGIGVYVGPDYVMLEGVMLKPRSDKPYVVSRVMFPPRVFETLVKVLNRLLEEYKKKLEEEKKKAVKK